MAVVNEPRPSDICIGLANTAEEGAELSHKLYREIDDKAGTRIRGNRYHGVNLDGGKALALVSAWNRDVRDNNPEWFI